MNCHNLPESASAYHAGELDKESAVRYEAHLASCPRCRSAEAEYRQGLEMLASWPVKLRTPELEPFLAELNRRIDQITPLQGSTRSWGKAWLPLALAAGLLLAVAGFWGWMRSPGEMEIEASRFVAESARSEESEFLELLDLALGSGESREEDSSFSPEEEFLLRWVASAAEEEGEAIEEFVGFEQFEDLLWEEVAHQVEGDAVESWGTEEVLEEQLRRLGSQELQWILGLFEQG